MNFKVLLFVFLTAVISFPLGSFFTYYQFKKGLAKYFCERDRYKLSKEDGRIHTVIVFPETPGAKNHELNLRKARHFLSEDNWLYVSCKKDLPSLFLRDFNTWLPEHEIFIFSLFAEEETKENLALQ